MTDRDTTEEVEWESLPKAHSEETSRIPKLFRTKVPGGWLVYLEGGALTYVPDYGHSWLMPGWNPPRHGGLATNE